MADGVETPLVTATPASGVSAPSPAIDPAEYAELRRFHTDATQTFSTLEPISDDVRWMLESDDNRDFIRQARKTYEESRTARQPAYDANTQAVLAEIAPLKEYVSAQQKREQESVRNAQADFARKTRTLRDSLVSAKPWLAENNDAGIYAIAAFGDRLGIQDLGEAAKAFEAAGQPKSVTPPRSLRGEAATAGVPGPSSLPPIKSQADLRSRIKSAFANQGR